jgi:DNA-binding NarL/FixJ family response regulator
MEIRILIVDDHPTVRESLRYVFAAAGIGRLREATTWQEAIDAAREGDVDLVALDVALRAGNGLDILRDIKCLDASVPVLVHSYHDHPRLLSHCFHLGAAGYVVKGNDKNELIRAVRQTAVGDHVWTAEQCARIRQWDAECGDSRSGERSVDRSLTLN